MTIAAYIRVSSKAQDHATQRDAIERLAVVRGEPVATWYAEKLSAKTMARPELQRLLADVSQGRIKTVMVFKLDRLCRTGVADTFKVVSALRSAGATLIAVADNLTIKPDAEGDIASECYVFALSLGAKIERTALNDRIAAARVRVEAEGGSWGRPPALTPAQFETVRRMKLDSRVTVRAIAQAIGISKTIVGRAVKGLSEAKAA
jgi:DNA invertase Pin-like site-specific DNA recombinase